MLKLLSNTASHVEWTSTISTTILSFAKSHLAVAKETQFVAAAFKDEICQNICRLANTVFFSDHGWKEGEGGC